MRAAMIAVLGVVAVAAGFYALLCLLLYTQQSSFIFFRVANDPLLVERWRPRRVEIPGPVSIEGWWAEGGNPTSPITMIYFGGNAEDVLYTAETAKAFDVGRVLATNYRGYGKTPGTPGEQALFEDALAIYDYAVTQPGVSANDIVVMGRSLGSGVATHLAAHRRVRSVVLVTPYDSMAAVGQGHYSIFPVRWLLKHKFESDKLAAAIDTPALLLAAEQDSIVPQRHAHALKKVWRGPIRLHVLERVGHNDIEAHRSYYVLINEFILAESVAINR
jgi:uncharacterized protein